MGIGEILFVVALAGGFLIPPIIFKQWRLFSVFAVFFACFGLMEWLSVAQTGQSISQHVWALELWQRGIICGGMALGWVGLLWHFMAHKQEKK